MAKTISSSLKTHLSGSGLTLARLVKIKRRVDNLIFTFTDHNESIIYDLGDGDGSLTYEASRGITLTALSQTAELKVDNLSADGFFHINGLKRADLNQGRFDFAEVKIFLLNYEDTSLGIMKLQRGHFGKVILRDNQYRVDFNGLAKAYEPVVGRIYQAGCQNDLGDERCQVDFTAAAAQFPSVTYTSNGTVASILVARSKFTATIADAPAQDGWFDFGLLTFKSAAAGGGQNALLSMDVKVHTHDSGTTHTIELVIPMLADIAVGDTFQIFAGCDKKTSTCINKFKDSSTDTVNNIKNFGGFPDIPGDLAARQKAPLPEIFT